MSVKKLTRILFLLFIPFIAQAHLFEAYSDRQVQIIKSGEKFGLVNQKGKEVLPAKYDSLQYTQNKEQYVAYISKNKKPQLLAGVITEKGKEIIPITFQAVTSVSLDLYAVRNNEGKTALYTNDGEQRTTFQFDKITAFKGNLARFYQDGNAGVISKTGHIKVPAKYKDVIIRNDQQVDVIHARVWKVLNGENKLLKELSYDSLRPVAQNRWAASTTFYDSSGKPSVMNALIDNEGARLIPYKQFFIYDFEDNVAKIKENQQFGLIDLKGQYVLPPAFDSIALVKDAALAGVYVNRQWTWHLFSLEGKKLSKHTYEAVVPQKSGLMPAKLNGKWGFIDQQGKEVLICRYDTVHAFDNGLAKVRLGEREGFINKEGFWQIKPVAEYILRITPSRYVAHFQDKDHLLDEEGNILFSTTNTLAFYENTLVESNSYRQLALIDLNTGQKLTSNEYDKISPLKEGEIYIAQRLGKRGILSKDGKKFIPESDKTFSRLFDMKEGFLAAQINGKQGFVDTQGRLRISNRYDSVTYYSDGYAAVSLLGRWGYIDKIERLKIQPLYDKAYPFEEGTAVVVKDGKKGLINKSGNKILDTVYDDIRPLSSGRFMITQGSKVGITDKEGNKLFSPKYDKIEDLKNGFFFVYRDNKKGVITYGGVSTIPLMYETIIYDKTNNVFLASNPAQGIERITIQ